MTKRITKLAALLLLVSRTAAADPVVLDITYGDFLAEGETAFGIWDQALAPTDLEIQTSFVPVFEPAFGFNPNPPIAFDAGLSSPTALLPGYADVGTLFGAFPGFAETFVWDLTAGLYTFILYDFIGDGLGLGGGYSLSANGAVVGSGPGAISAFPGFIDGIARLNFEIAAAPPPIDVPEPGTIGLLGLGLIGFAATRRRRT